MFRELNLLGNKAEFPAWLGRIPSQIGIPAGGSLSADEWKTLALVFGPLALPVVWDDWIDAAADEVKKATDKVEAKRRRLKKQHDRVVRQWEQSVSASQHTMEEPPPRPETPELPPAPEEESPRLKRGEMKLFLKLSAALTVLLARTVRIQDLELAHQRLLEYLQEYAELYGAKAVKPNFHWATHLFEQILDYGPVYGFWAFLQERLNFIIKSFRTNNHGNGELEVTMMRSYSALTSLRNILSSVLATSPNAPAADGMEKQVLKEVVDRLLADPLARGTWGSTAQSTEASPNVNIAYLLGHQRSPERLKPELATAVLHHINSQPAFFSNPILRASNPDAVLGRIFSNLVTPADYMILDGRKITAMDAKRGPKKATIIQARWRIADTERICVGELLKIFTASQAEDPLAVVQWLKPTNCHPLREDIWAEYRDVLDIKVWEFQVFTDDANQVPPAVIPLSKIVSQAARITVRKAKGSSEKLWLTIGLDKHGTRV
ncbi:hypothetical protein FRC00_003508 [Tulasnella sp. 408]|nr:hypothetical protein FRC00_003508 [Tulasnella sp. 408]